MNSAEIRSRFLEFFRANGHEIVPSSPLVPGNDPTLLFTNSGMVQFKDVFLGRDARPYARATSSQRCVRAGGKHNDLENVGYTARHHTFFEMLGNFSFGDYFKRDAIRYAWRLLTEVYGLPPGRLWVTVYQDDDEAFGIWADEVGVPRSRIVRIGDNKGARYASDNFWQMADTGPCGPCSEIFYDHGPEVAGGPPGSPDADGDRYIEIWNLVFMQFDRDAAGILNPLPRPCVDTGMGLERVAAVLQGVHSNYEIDLFRALIAAAARETGCADLSSPSLRVIADHIRACAFLVVDGVIPGAEGRGYVLRRIVRRALRHGHKLGQAKPFFHRLVADLSAAMGQAYPELPAQAERVAEVLRQEEERFGQTLGNGMQILEAALAALPAGGTAAAGERAASGAAAGMQAADGSPSGSARAADDGQASQAGAGPTLDGETAFKLYDTYGFPLDLTADVCRERGVAVDEAGFEAAMARQREQARAAGRFKAGATLAYQGDRTAFVGYDALEREATVTALYAGGAAVDSIAVGEDAVVVLDTTPFYAESGGQVGDAGELAGLSVMDDRERTCTTLFRVDDTQKIMADVFGHHGRLAAGELRVGDRVAARVDAVRRAKTVRNHSATHLMHLALRRVLGPHVQQKGSLVDADKTRFDFSHHAPMTDEQIRRVEALVNAEILANHPTEAKIMGFDEAVAGGAMALFGEKYGAQVRVLSIGSSVELCGGTHVARTGDIGLFKIVAETGVAAGIRRVEAVTGDNALAWVQQLDARLHAAAAALRAQPEEIAARIAQIQDGARALERELARLKAKVAASAGSDLAAQAIEVGGIKVLAAAVEGVEPRALRDLVDQLKSRLGQAAVVLGSATDGKVSLVAGVTADATAKVKAGELVNFVAQQVGGKGGGRPDLAMAGGTQPAKLPAALAQVQDWVRERL